MSLRHLKTWKIAFVRHFSLSFFLSSCLSIFFAPIFFPISLFKFLLLFVCKVMPEKIILEWQEKWESQGSMQH